jgi:cell wall-associated NlpC family hydrolase
LEVVVYARFLTAIVSLLMVGLAPPNLARAQQDKALLNYAPSSTEVAGRPPELLAHLRDNLFVVIDPLDARAVIIDGAGRVLGSSAPLPFFPETVRATSDEIVFGVASPAREVSLKRSVDPAAVGQLVERAAPVPAGPAQPTLRRVSRSSLMINRAAANEGGILVRSIRGGYLADVEQLGQDIDGRRYIQSSEVTGKKDATKIRVFVQRFSPRGELLDIAEVPIAEMDTVPKRFVAVNSDGTANALVPTQTELFLQKLEFHKAGARPSPVSAGPSSKVPISATIVPSDRSSLENLAPVPAGPVATPPTTRDQIIARANAYTAIDWTLRRENFVHDAIQNQCAKTEGRYWLRPRKLSEGAIGTAFGPMPYNWGGGDTPSSFLDKLARGFLAGNVCTCREPQYNQCQVATAAGVDCSGFVSRSWGIAKQGTSGLGAVARPVNDLTTQMRPGDAFNKAGSHVRLFVRYLPGPQLRFEVLESATNLRCEGVCRSVYTVAELAQYKPLRYRGVQE